MMIDFSDEATIEKMVEFFCNLNIVPDDDSLEEVKQAFWQYENDGFNMRLTGQAREKLVRELVKINDKTEEEVITALFNADILNFIVN